MEVDYSEFEIMIINRIKGVIDREILKGKDTQQIAEAIYLAWPDITSPPQLNDDDDADSQPTLPERY